MSCGLTEPKFRTGWPLGARRPILGHPAPRGAGKIDGVRAAPLIVTQNDISFTLFSVALTDCGQCADRDPDISDGSGGSMDILLVDDSKTMRGIMQRTIRQAGFRGLSVGEAENGVQGLEQLRTEQPKVILSDWNMPEMSGIEFLLQVRASANRVPFGFITSEGSAAIKEQAMNAGADFVITKPFSPEDLQAALTPILGKC
jgi:two-component system chemotaxis response regulator CheY